MVLCEARFADGFTLPGAVALVSTEMAGIRLGTLVQNVTGFEAVRAGDGIRALAGAMALLPAIAAPHPGAVLGIVILIVGLAVRRLACNERGRRVSVGAILRLVTGVGHFAENTGRDRSHGPGRLEVTEHAPNDTRSGGGFSRFVRSDKSRGAGDYDQALPGTREREAQALIIAGEAEEIRGHQINEAKVGFISL